MDIGIILIFILAAFGLPALFYMMMYGDEKQPTRNYDDNPGMSSYSVLVSNNRMRGAEAEGRKAFHFSRALEDNPYEDEGENKWYGQRFNMWYHWKTGWIEESKSKEIDNGKV